MAKTISVGLYSERANKFRPRSPKAFPEPEAHPGRPRNLFSDYCANSSIHGVKYFVGPNRTLVERLWWVAVSLLSIYGCGRLIQSVYNKWNRDPVVVTFAEKPTPVYQIPFPAVTLCPETKVKTSIFNFTRTYQIMTNPDLDEPISAKDVDWMNALIQACDFSFNEIWQNEPYDDNCVQLLSELAIPFNEMFLLCGWRDDYANCSNLFKLTLTESGICYTFNSFPGDELLRKSELHSDYEYVTESHPVQNFDIDAGYAPHSGVDSYPRRVLGSGKKAGLFILLKAENRDLDYLCGNSFLGFKVLLHTPAQFPQIGSQHIRIPLNQEVSISVDPLVIATSENVQHYAPSRRMCFFNRERYLRYFKVYTKVSCEIECLANYTLQQCGCVHFAMPHPSGVHICGMGNMECYVEAATQLQEMDVLYYSNGSDSFLQQCNCLPSCNFLQYNTEISQADFEWKRLIATIKIFDREMQDAQMSYLEIHFKQVQFVSIKRGELFGVTDFLANCGGILGLFMGVSILSIVEIVYYCTLKPFLARKNRKKRKRKNNFVAVLKPVEYQLGVINRKPPVRF